MRPHAAHAPGRIQDILILGGTVINHDHAFEADVLLSGGVVAAVSHSLTQPPGALVLNASGLLVMPGAYTCQAEQRVIVATSTAGGLTLTSALTLRVACGRRHRPAHAPGYALHGSRDGRRFLQRPRCRAGGRHDDVSWRRLGQMLVSSC